MNSFKIVNRQIIIHREGLPFRTMRAVFLTDLHNVMHGPGQNFLISAIHAASPSFILCGGDMVVGKKGHSPDAALVLMKQLTCEYPVYHALGNHEFRLREYPEQYGSLYEEYIDPIREAGVVLLDNCWSDLTIADIPFRIGGLSIEKQYYKRGVNLELFSSDIERLMGKRDKEKISILLAHNPKYSNAYLDYGCELTLCGHAHGGIIRLGEHRGLISPDLSVFSSQCYGEFQKGDSRLIIGAGLGEHTIPVRLHNPRELLVLDFIFS